MSAAPPRPWVPALTRGLPILLLATVALLGITPVNTGDVWCHLTFGEFFIQHGFAAHDPFVFTAGEERWVTWAWLADVIFYGVFRLAGLAGLTLFKAALFTLAVGLLWLLGAAVRCPPPAAALILLLAALVTRPRLVERPEIFTFVLLAAALAVLVRGGAGASGAVGRGPAWWTPYLLVPVQVLWANMHSSFVVGLFIPWAFVIDEVVRCLLRRPVGGGSHRSLWHLVQSALLLLPASLLTPGGMRTFTFPFRLLGMATPSQVDEYRGLITILQVCSGCMEEGIAFLFLAMAAVGACALARFEQTARPGTWTLVAGSIAVPFLVYRFAPYAALILGAVFMRALGTVCSTRPTARPDASAGGFTPPEGGPEVAKRSPVRRPLVWAGVIVSLLSVVAFHLTRDSRYPFGLGIAPDVHPVGAARFIQTTGAQGPMFNELDFGGYLLHSLSPRSRVFIHSAIWASVSDERLIVQYIRSARDPGTFEALVREYRIELLVLPNAVPAWRFVAADGRWALLFWDQVASVYARREGANAPLIAARAFRLTHYATDLTYLVAVAGDPGRFAAAAAELRRALREDPGNTAAGLSLAFLLKTRGADLAEALGLVAAAERRTPGDATLLTWRAEILAGLGRPAEAEAAVREALRRNPAARAARLVLADLRARAGDRDGAVRLLRELLARPDLSPDQRRDAEARLNALEASK